MRSRLSPCCLLPQLVYVVRGMHVRPNNAAAATARRRSIDQLRDHAGGVSANRLAASHLQEVLITMIGPS